MARQNLKFPLFMLTAGVLSGISSAGATAAETTAIAETPAEATEVAEASQLLAQTTQACQFGGFLRSYVRIDTSSGSPLRVRATPAGEPIGLIPDNWEVRVLEWSRNGYWVKVTDGLTEDSRGGSNGYATALDFREGWVSAGYVKDAGHSCLKPSAAAQLLQPELFGAVAVEVQGDWLAMGDQLLLD